VWFYCHYFHLVSFTSSILGLFGLCTLYIDLKKWKQSVSIFRWKGKKVPTQVHLVDSRKQHIIYITNISVWHLENGITAFTVVQKMKIWTKYEGKCTKLHNFLLFQGHKSVFLYLHSYLTLLIPCNENYFLL
jgi:hypothetical protein